LKAVDGKLSYHDLLAKSDGLSSKIIRPHLKQNKTVAYMLERDQSYVVT
jgi:hypothetical protein